MDRHGFFIGESIPLIVGSFTKKGHRDRSPFDELFMTEGFMNIETPHIATGG